MNFYSLRFSRAVRGLWAPTGSLLAALIVIAPVAALLWHAFAGDVAHWQHLLNNVVPVALRDTLILLAGVGVVVTVLGVGSAWLLSAYDFPGKALLGWALLLPLAVPTYIMAYAYLDLLHPIGPVQSTIRALLGYSSPREWRLPDVRNMTGAILILGFVLYPYVYLTMRAMFLTQAANLIEAARTLGAKRQEVFLRIVLPLARPAWAVGLSLALLETLNDIGASSFLGVKTLTVSVYTAWTARSDLAAAAQIALTMLVVIIGLILIERKGRARQRFANTQKMQPMRPRTLHGPAALMALSLGLVPVLIGFVIPAAYLCVQAWKRLNHSAGVSRALLDSLYNTLLVASLATLITVAVGLMIAWAGRTLRESAWRQPARGFARVGSLGYALPGTVLAIGLMTPAMLIENLVGGLLGTQKLFLMGSTGLLIIAYCIRFLAIPIGAVEAGLTRVPASIEHAARTLGERPGATLRRVHLPLLRPALAASALLVFVDTMKELSATLLLRPLDFDTLATRLYAEASRGTYEEGAIAAILIVLAGLLPVMLLARTKLSYGH
ncbi:iron ABC transporter permease [Pseudomonas sp. 21LCFQ010]|uniref:ABC transporter permease n=1 Tax=unclassified Pseudomonas TaxID=196821 RepID=UPI0004F58849|nr:MULTISPECIES: iron ABC transporter permease [unclassified Pseudomonas]MCO8165570.1 iron ABC transporter permease [Pseudomonas sp. 21LCFQ010]BAP45522.1 iron (Fe3+) ABC superfamily ATP binding cassette transporter, membrane protein [Pseudomonas sp. StFLB209]